MSVLQGRIHNNHKCFHATSRKNSVLTVLLFFCSIIISYIGMSNSRALQMAFCSKYVHIRFMSLFVVFDVIECNSQIMAFETSQGSFSA